MKVAILTTHRANNFGAILQAYSLVMKCRELGADAEIIDWRNPFFEKVYHKAWRMHRNPLPAVRHLIWFLGYERSSRKMFAAFRDSMPKSRPIFDRKALLDAVPNYDVFIVGSDQVWNPVVVVTRPGQFDTSYILDFVKKGNCRKYSYAASLGDRAVIDKSLLDVFAREWKSYDAITMRERSGADYVSKQLGKPVRTVMDPVLLHDVEYWRKVAERATKVSDEDFALMYNLRQSRQLSSFAQNLTNGKGLALIDLLIPGQLSTSCSCKTNAGPAELLWCIDKAKFVFTGSFHCAAFAIIYGKKLFLQVLRGGDDANARLDTLFQLCGLEGQNVFEDGDVIIKYYDCTCKNELLIKSAVAESTQILADMITGSYKY